MADVSKLKVSNGTVYDIKDASAVSGVTKSGDTITVAKRGGTSSTFDLDTYSIAKLTTPDSGFLATYQLQKNGTAVGANINIPKDYLVKSANMYTCTTADTPVTGYVVGDKYIDFVVNTASEDGTATHLYLLVSDLVDTYTSGNGINIANNAISVKVVTGTGLSVDSNGLAFTHPDSGATAGTYTKVTVDAQGHVTTGANPTTLSGYGITDGFSASNAATIQSSSTASRAFTKGEYIVYNGTFYRVKTAVASGATWTVGTNIVATTVGEEIVNAYENALASVKSISIPAAASWTQGTNSVEGSDVDHYYVTVTISGLTVASNTKVDLEPDATTIAQMLLDETQALWIETDGTTLKAHCLGNPPSVALTIQCTCSDVIL